MRLFTNNANTTLASGITSGATSLTVASGDGAKFPNPTSPDYFLATLEAGSVREIVKVTARSTDTFTIVRAQEGTSAAAWSAGDKAELRLTAGALRVEISVSPKTGAYTVATTDAGRMIACDTSSGAFTITLPSAATAGDGFTITVQKVSSDTNAVTLDANAAELIDGRETLGLYRQWDQAMLVCSGSAWYALSRKQIIAFRAHKNGADQALSSGTTKLTWAAVTYDATGDMDLANERYTVTVPGLYMFGGCAYLSVLGAADVGHNLTLYKNGSSLAVLSVVHVSNTGNGITVTGWQPDFAVAGDYYELFLGANSSVTVSGNSGNSWFAGVRMQDS